ncbi:NAD-dependent epimerase/dehydratase family protein [Dethiosulfatarculus sandiegensis]|uniref:Oxidoreductase n=1 Tax=Dethiosulfatarculus sandiegensis TaxID=1429043 RepID=A0A0D2IY10_9BACT|nr:NAD-dependent epimerase/dehydratase family protein [Dethiosulfatarculus sandiegensis]KIX10914.1 oxidoreductase [Dethiosulfatarculus sandiegensis]
MRVLVTGGTGFTGSHLVRRLLARGDEVLVLDKQPGLFADELKAKGAKITLGSVTNADLCRKLVDGCEIVHHLAAAFREVNRPNSVYTEVNREGTRRLCQAALDAGVRRLVYCSTQGVHGNVDNPPGDEDTPIEPEDFYQYSKHQGELVVNEFLDKGLESTILRPMAIFGPGDPARFLMIYKRVAKGRFIMAGPGNAFYHPLYIDNFIDAFELAENAPEAVGRAYLIGDDEYVTIKDLVLRVGKALDTEVKIVHVPFWPVYAVSALCELLYKPLPAEPPLFRRRADWFRQNRAFKIDRARKELGYDPKISVDEGLRRTGQWYRENGYI